MNEQSPENHSEIKQDAEQITLRHLIQLITNKTNGANEVNGSRGAELFGSDKRQVVATVWSLTKDTFPDNPTLIGHIYHEEADGDESLMVNYFILDTPNGLHIEVERWPIHNLDRDKMEGLAKIYNDKTGLKFVSEQEARDLLNLVDPLEPELLFSGR